MRVSNGIETLEVDESRLAEAEADGFKPLVRVSNGSDVREVHPDDLALAEADGFRAEGGVLETAGDLARGVVQGESLGFGDELKGANDALAYGADESPVVTALSAMSPAGMGKNVSEMVMNHILGRKNGSDTIQTYEKSRDAERTANREARTRSPVAYNAGQVGGAVATSVIPGGGAAKLAATGAAEGLGASEADLLEGDVVGAARDTAIGGATGLAFAGAGKIAGKLAGKLTPAVKPERFADPYLPVQEAPAVGAKAAQFVGNAGKKVGEFFEGLGSVPKAAMSVATGGKSNMINRAAKIAERAPELVKKGALISAETIDMLAPQLGKFGPILVEAAQRGGNSLATTNFLLQQTDPEYQEALKNLNEENQ